MEENYAVNFCPKGPLLDFFIRVALPLQLGLGLWKANKFLTARAISQNNSGISELFHYVNVLT